MTNVKTDKHIIFDMFRSKPSSNIRENWDLVLLYNPPSPNSLPHICTILTSKDVERLIIHFFLPITRQNNQFRQGVYYLIIWLNFTGIMTYLIIYI